MTKDQLGALISMGQPGRFLPFPDAQPLDTADKAQLVGLARQHFDGTLTESETPPTTSTFAFIPTFRRRRR